MSAWRVSENFISYLVEGAITYRMLNEEDKDSIEKMGNRLWRENFKSVNYRYHERKKAPKFVFVRRKYKDINPYQLIRSIHCYYYQTCEHPSFERSLVRRWLLELESNVAWGIAATYEKESATRLIWGEPAPNA